MQNNKTQKTELSDEQRRLLRQQATATVTVYLKSFNSEKEGHVIEHLAMLFSENEDGYTYDEGAPFEYQSACISLLGLLANPAISGKLDKHLQPDIGKLLIRMIRFFENISDTVCQAAFSLYQAENSDDGEDLKRLTRIYKSLLAERQFSFSLSDV